MKLPKPEFDVLKLDCSRAVQGSLDVGDHTITGIRSSSQDNAALTVGGARATYLTLYGGRGMESYLNMNNHEIRNLKMPNLDPSSGNQSDDCAIILLIFMDKGEILKDKSMK